MAKKRKIIREENLEPIVYSDIKIKSQDEEVIQLVNFLKSLIDEEDVARIIKEKAREALIELSKEGYNFDVKKLRIISIFDELNEEPNLDPFSRTVVWNLLSMIESL